VFEGLELNSLDFERKLPVMSLSEASYDPMNLNIDIGILDAGLPSLGP